MNSPQVEKNTRAKNKSNNSPGGMGTSIDRVFLGPKSPFVTKILLFARI
jgi:hypothetical protein